MKQYVVDAFTEEVFSGNPAAVCIMDVWLDDSLMQNITIENNLSETAFAVKENNLYHIRWFTPGGEVDLCGHATLATAFVILSFYETKSSIVVFTSLSGELIVKKNNQLYEMNFPIYELKQVEVTKAMEKAIGIKPLEAWLSRDLVCVLPTEEDVLKYTPDMNETLNLEGMLLHTTALSKNYDCISRSYAPKLNIPEDPVCGSGHCHIVPLWSKKLNKKDFVAYHGKIDGLINNAGISQQIVHFKDLDQAVVDKVLNINLLSVISTSRIFLSEIVKSEEGLIANVSSMGGDIKYAWKLNLCSNQSCN